MKALILAAGYATRLYPITREYPKPLLKVNNKPIIDYIVEKLQDIDEIDLIYVVTNNRFMPQFRKWSKGLSIKKPLKVVNDLTRTNETRLGAIGDINFVIKHKRLKDDLLVIGGDNLFDGGLSGFLSFAKARRRYPAIGVFNIGNKSNARKYGIVKAGPGNRIIDFKEKPVNPESTLVAMCLYYLPADKLKTIGEYLSDETKKRDATGLYIEWLRKKLPVYAFVFGGRWYDIGDHKFYNEAKQKFAKR